MASAFPSPAAMSSRPEDLALLATLWRQALSAPLRRGLACGQSTLTEMQRHCNMRLLGKTLARRVHPRREALLEACTLVAGGHLIDLDSDSDVELLMDDFEPTAAVPLSCSMDRDCATQVHPSDHGGCCNAATGTDDSKCERSVAAPCWSPYAPVRTSVTATPPAVPRASCANVVPTMACTRALQLMVIRETQARARCALVVAGIPDSEKRAFQ